DRRGAREVLTVAAPFLEEELGDGVARRERTRPERVAAAGGERRDGPADAALDGRRLGRDPRRDLAEARVDLRDRRVLRVRRRRGRPVLVAARGDAVDVDEGV